MTVSTARGAAVSVPADPPVGSVLKFTVVPSQFPAGARGDAVDVPVLQRGDAVPREAVLLARDGAELVARIRDAKAVGAAGGKVERQVLGLVEGADRLGDQGGE